MFKRLPLDFLILIDQTAKICLTRLVHKLQHFANCPFHTYLYFFSVPHSLLSFFTPVILKITFKFLPTMVFIVLIFEQYKSNATSNLSQSLSFIIFILYSYCCRLLLPEIIAKKKQLKKGK